MIERMNFDYDVSNDDDDVVSDTKTASIALRSEAISLQDVAYAMKRFLLASGYMVDEITISTGSATFRSG